MQFLVEPVNSAQEICLVLQPYPVYLVLANLPANVSLLPKKDQRKKPLSSEKAITNTLLILGKSDLFGNILPGNREKSTSFRVRRPHASCLGLSILMRDLSTRTRESLLTLNSAFSLVFVIVHAREL